MKIYLVTGIKKRYLVAAENEATLLVILKKSKIEAEETLEINNETFDSEGFIMTEK